MAVYSVQLNGGLVSGVEAGLKRRLREGLRLLLLLLASLELEVNTLLEMYMLWLGLRS